MLKCYEVASGAVGEKVWKLMEPDFIVDRGGLPVLELPCQCAATHDGRPVVLGTQVVANGGFLWIEGREGYALVPVRAVQEAGQGRPCAVAGIPIAGEAVRCVNPILDSERRARPCNTLLSADVARELSQCPRCKHPLRLDDEPPPEALL